MTQSPVPTIRDVINQVLPPSAQREYRHLIDNVVSALTVRETNLHATMAGGPMSDTPAAPFTASDQAVASDLSDADRVTVLEAQVAGLIQFARTVGYRPPTLTSVTTDPSLEARVTALERQVGDLMGFARQHGYRL